MKKEKLFLALTLVFGLLFYCVFFTVFFEVARTDKHYNETSQKIRIDSISVKSRYEVIPDNVYTLHTRIGPVFTNDTNYKVGDSIIIKTIIL
jgi:hypothetical protein